MILILQIAAGYLLGRFVWDLLEDFSRQKRQ